MPKILDFICLEDKFLLLKIAKSLAKCGLRPGRWASALRAKESESTTSSQLRKFQRWLGPSARLDEYIDLSAIAPLFIADDACIFRPRFWCRRA